MIHRLGRKNFDIYAMDVESHNDEESIAKGETSIWLGTFINENSSMYDEDSYFYTIEQFLEKVHMLSARKRKRGGPRVCNNIAVYIYNLSFEWSFILPVLLKLGFTFRADIGKEDEMCFNSVSTKSVSSVWQASIKYGRTDGIIIFRDLSKIFGGGLGAVAKAFKLPTQKGEIDYKLNRLHMKDSDGNEIPWIPTKEEKEYCFKDTRIIIDVLLKEVELNDNDFFKSVSMASYSMLKLLKAGYPRKTKPYKAFREDYPELGEEENEFVRKALSGGICYATRKYQFLEVNQPILHIDAHQMYPSQVYLKPHPCGRGEYFKGKPTKVFKHINCCHIRVSYSDVKIHSIIQLIGQPFIEGRELYVWDFEIPTMYKCYEDLEIEYIDGYCYESKMLPWRNFVKENYDKRLKAKREGDAYNTLRYKLLNNSGAYGKFVEKPHNTVNENYINSYGIIDSKISEKEEVKATAKYTYIPLATIPAYGRVCLVETALKFGWENILYFDTDSIFCLWNEETQRVWATINQKDELGGWGLEEICHRAQFTAPKRYKLEVDGKTTIKAGGMNFDFYKENTHKAEMDYLMSTGLSRKEALSRIDIPFDEVNIISSEWKVQRAYRCKGGTIILFQDKKMEVQKKYIGVYERNVKEVNYDRT